MYKPFFAAVLIGHSTTQEALRSKLLRVCTAFMLLLWLVAVAATSTVGAERARLVIDVGLAAQSGLGSLVALSCGVGLYGMQVHSQVSYNLLARSLPRWSYVLGRALGICAATSAVILLISLSTAAAVFVLGGAVPGVYWVQLGLCLIQGALVACIAMLFCSFAMPVAATIYTAAVVLAGFLSSELLAVASLQRSKTLQGVLHLAYAIVPDLSHLSLRSAAANELPWTWEAACGGAAYGTLYAAAALFAAMLVLQRRRHL